MTVRAVERQTCATCLYWNEPTSECRFYPPPPRLFNENLKTFANQQSPTTGSLYWCGQHSFWSDTIVESSMEDRG